ncbi:MAG: M23 family metallopeptidase [Patescibacteria group bacterium]|nr:M23 family metallopeptidase [Patescibacteria group bacterium]
MPLAQSYSSNPQAKRNQDVGPSPFQQMSSAFAGASANPLLKVAQYTVLPAAENIPILGKPITFLKWATDPVGELKKSLNISPSVGAAVKESIITNAVAYATKVYAVSAGVASGQGQITTDLVQNAMACEAADYATKAARNPTKFIIQETWNGLVKGGWFFDRFIYDKRYVFWHDETGKASKWEANRIAKKFGLKGEDLRFGSQAFKVINVDKPGGLTPVLKVGKVTWQIAGPTVLAAVLFPPLAPVVLAWQVANASWSDFVIKHPVVPVPPDPNLVGAPLEAGRSKGGNKNLLRDVNREWVAESSGQTFKWYELNNIADDKIRRWNKVFKTVNDFATVRGLYNTLVTGNTLKERGWAIRGGYADQRIRFGSGAGEINELYARASVFNRGRGRHFHPGVLRRPDGSVITIHPGQKISGKQWSHLSASVKSNSSRFFRGAYRFQQFASKIGVPAALAVLLPNPATWGFAAFMVARNLGSVLEPLKWVGWKSVEYTSSQFIAKYGLKYGTAAVKNIGPLVLVLEDNGTNFLRRWLRRFYSVLHPFDRDVGVLAGAVAWRDRQWATIVRSFWRSSNGLRLRATFIKYPWIRQTFDFLKKLPGAGTVAAVGGFFLGGLKWVLAPGQAIKDAVGNFIKWTAWRGFRWALGKAFRSWFSHPLTAWLQRQVASLPIGSLRRSFFDFLLRRLLAPAPLPKIPTSPLGKFGAELVKALAQIGKMIFRFVTKLLIEAGKAIVKIVVQVFQTISDAVAAVTSPAWGTVAVIVVAILAIFLLLALIVIVIFLALAFVSSMGASGTNMPPVSSFLEIRKEVANPKPSGQLFAAGDTVQYLIQYEVKKPLSGAVTFEDRFLISGVDKNGATVKYFDQNSLSCQSPASITTVTFASDPDGPPGNWQGLKGTVPYHDPGNGGPQWVQFNCSAKVDSGYNGGVLVNHAIISGNAQSDGKLVTASQWLKVNGGDASGWPTDHGCFVQGPNGAYSHQNQQAVDIASNWSSGYNIAGQPIHATIDGKVLRICVSGTYSANASTGVCGGYDEGSYFGTGFGTYVILKETNTSLSVFYGHLLQPSASLAEGQIINKGDIIGYVDSTGNSTGNHVHYAFTRNSGAEMNQPYVPYYVPTCSLTSPDPTCPQAFADLGEPGRVCF